MSKSTAPISKSEISDLELFAKAYFKIELTSYQLEIIDAISKGKRMLSAYRSGRTTAMKVMQAYIAEGLKPGGRVRLPQIQLPAKREIKGVTQEGRVLNAIKSGGAFNFELSRIALKYTSVISALRKDGHEIIAEPQYNRNGKRSNTFRYYLIGD